MSSMPFTHIRKAVRVALQEDLSLGDATTVALFPRRCQARGQIVAHQDIVTAGMAVATATFLEVDPSLKLIDSVQDGTSVTEGDAVLILEGDARSLLMAERVALNFLQHLSGIATVTAQFCEAVRGYPTKILDTRKTLPGLRALEKWAVRLGGGVNHRHSLGDGILIKDNHLAILRAQGLGVTEACRLARERGPHGLRVIIEVESIDDVRHALEGSADVILLDNMPSHMVRRAVEFIKGRALVEVSGGITLQTARAMAEAGADYISVGALTHSAPAANLSMDLVARRSAPRKNK